MCDENICTCGLNFTLDELKDEITSNVRNINLSRITQLMKDIGERNSDKLKNSKIILLFSDGYNRKEEYNDSGKMVYATDSYGNTETRKYDISGNLIYSKIEIKMDNEIEESWYEYDEKGNVIYTKDSSGHTEEIKYNNDGKIIYIKVSYYPFNYGALKQIMNIAPSSLPKYLQVIETWIDFDDSGNEHMRDSKGHEYWKKFNKKGELIHFEKSDGYEEWFTYDDKGNLIHKEDSKNNEMTFEYNQNNNVTLIKGNDLAFTISYNEDGLPAHTNLFFIENNKTKVSTEFNYVKNA